MYDFTIDRNFDVYVTGRCGSYLSTVKLVQYMTSSTESEKSMTIEYELIGNFPNPFNPATQIVLRLDKACNVKLEVHDAGGRKIAALLNTWMPSGRHEVAFDSRNYGGLSSGVYFYTLKAAEYSKTLRMVVVK